MWSISYLRNRPAVGGAAAPVINIAPDSYSNVVVDTLDAAASISFNPSGLVSVFASTGTPYTWRVGGLSSDYSIFAHKLSGGTLEGIAEETWVNLASVRTFGVAQLVVGTKTWVGTLAIRKDSPGTVLNTVNIDFLATVQAAAGGGGGGGGGPPSGGGGGGIDP